ncbi:MAG: hypothetical protein AAB066_01625, partial [Candidatus Margulisiibacteriota bacterium]
LLEIHDETLNAPEHAAISQNGEFLAIGFPNLGNQLLLIVFRNEGHGFMPFCSIRNASDQFCFHPSSQSILVAQGDTANPILIRQIDLRTGKSQVLFSCKDYQIGDIYGMAWSDNGQRALVNVLCGEALFMAIVLSSDPNGMHRESCAHGALSPCGNRLAFFQTPPFSKCNQVHVRSLGDHSLTTLTIPNLVWDQVGFSPDGRLLVLTAHPPLGSGARKVLVLDWQTGGVLLSRDFRMVTPTAPEVLPRFIDVDCLLLVDAGNLIQIQFPSLAQTVVQKNVRAHWELPSGPRNLLLAGTRKNHHVLGLLEYRPSPANAKEPHGGDREAIAERRNQKEPHGGDREAFADSSSGCCSVS